MIIKDALSQNGLEKFHKILKEMIKDGILKIVAAQIDPDLLAAAIEFKYIVQNLLQEVTVIVYYGGKIGKLNDRFANFFSLREWFVPISDYPEDDLGDVILLDSSKKNDNRLRDKKFNPRIVVDHHLSSDIEETKDNWVSIEQVGASATLVTELIKALKIKIGNDEESQKVATMGALGIANDTHNFTEKVTTKRDRNAWNWLMEQCNQEHYARLSKLELPKRYYELLHDLTSKKNRNYVFQETFLLANVGLMTEEEVEFLALYADSLIERKEIQRVVVWAPVKGLGFAVKMRSTDIDEDTDSRIREIFGAGGAKSKWAVGAGGALIYMDPERVPKQGSEEVDIDWFRLHTSFQLAELLNTPIPES